MSDIDQQAVFDRLPLTAEQRTKLYAALTGAEPQMDSAILVSNSASPDSPVILGRTPDHLTDCPV